MQIELYTLIEKMLQAGGYQCNGNIVMPCYYKYGLDDMPCMISEGFIVWKKNENFHRDPELGPAIVSYSEIGSIRSRISYAVDGKYILNKYFKDENELYSNINTPMSFWE